MTQAMLGAVTAQLGFRRRIGGDAPWVAAFAATAADLDMLVEPLLNLGSESSAFTSMRVHRNLSHSLVAVPVLAALITVLWWWARRRAPALRQRRPATLSAPASPPPHPLWLFACTLVACLVHPLLDTCTSYGTVLLAPWRNTRFALDIVAIVDVFYSGVLLLTLLACGGVHWRQRRRGLPMQAAPVATIGLALSTLYLGLGWVLHEQAIRQAVQTFRSGHFGGVALVDRTEFRAYPQLGSVFLWRVTRRTDRQWYVGQVNYLFDKPFLPLHFVSEKRRHGYWVRQARQVEDIQTFIWFARGQVRFRYRRENDRFVVIVDDMRYALDPGDFEPLWSAQVTFDYRGDVLQTGRIPHRRGGNLREFAARAWRRIWTPTSVADGPET